MRSIDVKLYHKNTSPNMTSETFKVTPLEVAVIIWWVKLAEVAGIKALQVVWLPSPRSGAKTADMASPPSKDTDTSTPGSQKPQTLTYVIVDAL